MPEKIFLVSLGCPKNLADAEVLAGGLAEAGYGLTADEAKAGAVLINTCAFLRSAVKESEKEIRRFSALKKSGKIKKILVAGCLVERERDALLKKFPQVDAVVGINALDKAAAALDGRGRCFIAPVSALTAPELKLRLTAPHSAYLKVADGCDNRCAYCAIPAIRGRFRSKPLDQVVGEAEDLVRSGAKEISLIAQDTTLYGADLYGRPKLCALLKKLVKLRGLKWLRLMYVYPERVTADILRLIRDEEKLCHYLDMPLQHISDRVLKNMNRRSTGKTIRAKLAEIRRYVPDMALRTSFITGFPGETEKDFSELLGFVAEAGFDNVAVFPYSREPGTPAAALPGQLPARVKNARARSLIAAQSRVLDGKNRALAGKTVKVLLDSPSSGRTYRDAPEIDGRVEITGAAGRKAGDFVSVRITGAAGYIRRGIIAPGTVPITGERSER
ncbi:MAG: ribosomal protein S12 methylthiotransferase RimO [Elusimicrobia bacterium RIFOXYB2_FULL_62_6]|nr:MAG: ribosomal protein S12 methylthiotransferase RimO [Elusimicrobia bacterium RIFOXYB2_FULL_62_6]